MKQALLFGTSVAALALGAGIASADDPKMFNRITSYDVSANAADPSAETSAEILVATEDGMTLVYSDSPAGSVGFIDITDPAAPKGAGAVAVDGEPTSVAVAGGKVLVGVNTSESYTAPSGFLGVMDLASKSMEATCDLGGQPDSVAVSPDGSIVAIAIENERDEDLDDGVIPQMPAGNVTIFKLNDGVADCDSKIVVDVTGIGDTATDDPEPEYVSINDDNEIVVTLQENNGLAVIDGNTGEVKAGFSAGSVDLDNVDLKEEDALTFDGTQHGRKREADAVKWLDNDRFVTANEGDYEGGSRGFTIYSDRGEVLFESGLQLEYAAAMAGHYPEARSGNKGVEPEGLEAAQFGDDKLFFVTLERSSLIGVYKDTGGEPEFLQLLPSGIGPESVVALPERGLLVSANEVDLVEDGGVRAHVMVYEHQEAPAVYPTIASGLDDNGRPVGWGALSGLVADADEAGKLYAVNDSFYGMQPSVFVIDATAKPAKIVNRIAVTRAGFPAQKLDLEGIALAEDGGFWLASEGRPDRVIPHAIYKIDANGEIEQEIAIPDEMNALQKRYGFEGITTVGTGEELTLWMAIQREWKDDEDGFVKLISYKPASEEWAAVRYPLEGKDKGWVGLSEITAHGDHLYIVERDNQIGSAAKLKKLFRVAIADLDPKPLGDELTTVTKEEVRDFIPDLAGFGGYVVDKLEGFAVDANGEAFAVTDNDGVDDSSGETFFFSIGKL